MSSAAKTAPSSLTNRLVTYKLTKLLWWHPLFPHHLFSIVFQFQRLFCSCSTCYKRRLMKIESKSTPRIQIGLSLLFQEVWSWLDREFGRHLKDYGFGNRQKMEGRKDWVNELLVHTTPHQILLAQISLILGDTFTSDNLRGYELVRTNFYHPPW